MPKPKKGEGRSEYLHRAIPQIMDEGKTQEQAVGQAEGMYDSAKKAMIAETPVEMTERSVGPGLANPEDGVQCESTEAYRVRRAALRGEVFKQARMAGFGPAEADEAAKGACRRLDAGRVREVRKALLAYEPALRAIREGRHG